MSKDESMNNKCILLFLLIINSFSAFSQSEWFHYKWDTEDQVDKEVFYQKAYQYDLKRYKNSAVLGNDYQDFVNESVLYLYEDMARGNIYQTFSGEKYIRSVLEEVVKDTSLTNHIQIVFYRNPSINASMSESGILRLNVGTMARLNNEAELAMLLGHEVAHFMNDDMAKRYIRSKYNMDVQVKMKWKWNGMVIYAAPNMWYNRDQEEAADFASALLIRHSPYSLKLAGNLYRIFKREEIRSEIRNGKQDEDARTHPDPGDRMKMVKGFAADSVNRGKKKFVVDSAAFVRLKETCFMETVNIGLMRIDLDEVLTLTFSRYLMEPENEANLAVLIETLRRYILLGESTKVSAQPFILNSYLTKKPEALKNYPFLAEKNPSILNYLSKGFVDIWKEDIKNIKATDLRDSTVTEFTTVQEAYDYFKKKAEEHKGLLARHYKYFGPEADFSDVTNYQASNPVFLSNDYLGRTKDSLSPKSTVVIVPFNGYTLSKIHESGETREAREQFNSEYAAGMKKDQTSQVLRMNEFSFSEQRTIRDLAHICYALEITPGSDLVQRSKVNWFEIYPELYSLFKKQNVSDLYICIPSLTEVPGSFSVATKIMMTYYKVSLPGRNKTKTIISGCQKTWNMGILINNQETFFKEVSKHLNYFISSTKYG